MLDVLIFQKRNQSPFLSASESPHHGKWH